MSALPEGECEVEEDLRGPRERRLRVTQSRRGFRLSTRRLCILGDRRVLRFCRLSTSECLVPLATRHQVYPFVRMVFAGSVDVHRARLLVKYPI
jgi:hypothetical protein